MACVVFYLFTLAVQRGGGVVEDEDFGVSDQRPGDGHSLLLTAAQLGAFAAHVGVITLQSTA